MYVRKNMRKERIMEQNKSQQYEDRQIAKSNGGDVLIEFQDSLNYGETKRIHGKYSLIKIVMCNYKNKDTTGSITVKHYVDPDFIKYLLSLFYANKDKVYITQDKIHSGIDEKTGLSHVSKLLIARQPVRNDGSIARMPWYVKIEEGTGKQAKNMKTGGVYIASGSYKKEKEAAINMTDEDFFIMLEKCRSYIERFEHEGMIRRVLVGALSNVLGTINKLFKSYFSLITKN